MYCTVLYFIRSNIPLRLKEFPRAKPEGTPEGEGVYLTVYPEWSPNMDRHKASNFPINLIDNKSLNSLGSVL